MKHKNVHTKVLLMILCFVLALACLVGCNGDDELAAIKAEVDGLKNQVIANTNTLGTVESKENVAKLQALVDEIKQTADAAATLEALTEVSDKLAAVTDTANAAATQAALTEAIATLQGQFANGDTTLLNKLNALQATVNTNAANANTKLEELKAEFVEANAALNAVDAQLQASINSNAALTADNFVAVNEAIDALEAATELNLGDLRAELLAGIQTNGNAINRLDAALEDLAYTMGESFDSIRDNVTQITDNLAAQLAENAEKDAELKAELTAAKAQLRDSISANANAIAAIDATIADLDNTYATDAEVDAIKNALENIIAENRETLEASIEALREATNGNLSALKGQLEDYIDSKDSLLAGNIATVEGMIATLETVTGQKFIDLEAQLQASIDSKASLLQNNIDAVEELVDALEEATGARFDTLKAELEEDIRTNGDAITTLQSALTGLTSATEEQFTQITDNFTAKLQENADADAQRKEELEQAMAALQNLIDANADAIDDLRAELEEKIQGNSGAIAGLTSSLNSFIGTTNTQLSNIISDLDDNAAADALLKDALDAFKTETSNKFAQITADFEGKLQANAAADALLKADLETLKETVDTLAGTLETAKSNLQTQINDNATAISALNTAVTALQTNSATKTEVQTAVSDLNATILAEVGELEAKISQINTTLATLATTQSVSDLQTKVNTLSTELADLKDGIVSSTEYKAASEVLMGVYRNPETNEPEYTDYSLAKFDEFVAKVKLEDYDQSSYDKFHALAEMERFYLGRALTIADILESFERLQALYDQLPTIKQMVDCRLNQIDGLGTCYDATHDHAATVKIEVTESFANFFNDLATAYNKMKAEDQAELFERFSFVNNAYANLLDAKTASEAINAQINAIVTPLVYGTSEIAVQEARAAVTLYNETYFTNDSYNAVYGEKDFLDALATLEGYEATLANLAAAFDSKPVAIEIPAVPVVYTELGTLQGHLDAINAWAEANGIDDANRAAMYTPEYLAKLDTAIEYATKMNTIYGVEGHDVATLLENIKALYAEGRVVVLADKDAAIAYRTALIALNDAINLVAADYGVTDTVNYLAMVGEVEAKFADVEARIVRLEEAKGKFDQLIVDMDALLAIITPDQGIKDQIDAFGDAITDLCTEYGLVEGNADHTEIAGPAIAKKAELDDKYADVTKEIIRIYEVIRDALAEIDRTGKINLAIGNTLDGLQEVVAELVNTWGVTNPNLSLTIEEQEVKLNELLDEYYGLVANYNVRAQEAASAAENVSATIELTLALSNKDLKNLEFINLVVDTLMADWIEEYLIIVDTNENGIYDAEEIVAALDAIKEISIINGIGTYKFLTSDEYNNIVAHQDAIEEHKVAADQAWATLKDTLVGLTGSSTIHSDFETPVLAYQQYVADYYADSIPAANEEAVIYADFLTAKAIHDAKVLEAGAKVTEIKDSIVALGDWKAIDASNASDILAKVAIINGLIDAYKADYCDLTAPDCNCDITDAELLNLAKVKAMAVSVLRYEEFKTEYAAELAINTDVATDAEGLMTTYIKVLDNATTVALAEKSPLYVINTLLGYEAQLRPVVAA